MLTEADLFRDCGGGADAERLERTLNRCINHDQTPHDHAVTLRALSLDHEPDVLLKYATEWQAILRIAIGTGAIQPPLPCFKAKTRPQEEFTALHTARKSMRFLQLVEYSLSDTPT